MSPTDILWIFFVLAALQPVVRRRMLEASRMRLLQRIEQKRKSRVIALIHRQETMSLLGFPIMRYIDIDDSEEILRAIRLTDPHVPIDLILHTPGGLVLATKQIARALKRHPAKVTVFIPHYAMSGGTLIALAADEIVMDENAVLGPLDPQLGQYPAASILRAVEAKGRANSDDQTLIMADLAEKAIQQVRETILEVASEAIPRDKLEKLADELSCGRWTHDYPITVDHARALGLPVSTDLPEEVYHFMNLFRMPVERSRPSVQYIPVPYYAPPPGRPEGRR
ncbi:MAG: ATP-dependent Clp protease proteolytic subunit [candidate division KSB1 bacterium]|nr:ATP-dependent Clp protease proteolytic subunit [candidate division KSB1 bacterium]